MGDEVIRLEVGGVLEAGGDPVNVEAGMPEHEFGWSDCTVVRFLQEDSCGLLQADQAHGDIQFEAPEEVRGQDLRNFRVSAHIFIGADGQPQANEVRLGASSSSSAGRGGKNGGVPTGQNGGPSNPYYKTQPCPYMMSGGQCPMQGGCFFAHSPQELRMSPEQMAKKAAKQAKKANKDTTGAVK